MAPDPKGGAVMGVGVTARKADRPCWRTQTARFAHRMFYRNYRNTIIVIMIKKEYLC